MAREVCEIHVADTSAADPALQVVGRFAHYPAQVQSPEGGAASGYPLLLRLHLEAARPLETDKYEI